VLRHAATLAAEVELRAKRVAKGEGAAAGGGGGAAGTGGGGGGGGGGVQG